MVPGFLVVAAIRRAVRLEIPPPLLLEEEADDEDKTWLIAIDFLSEFRLTKRSFCGVKMVKIINFIFYQEAKEIGFSLDSVLIRLFGRIYHEIGLRFHRR